MEHTRFDGECRNFGKHGHKAADCWYKQQHIPQGKGKGTGMSKSNIAKFSERDTSKQAEETWSPNTSWQPLNLSQVNAIGDIGRADDGLWIFSVEDSQKRRYSVNWKVATHDRESDLRTRRRTRIDDRFWMLRTFLSTLVRTTVPFGGFFKR